MKRAVLSLVMIIGLSVFSPVIGNASASSTLVNWVNAFQRGTWSSCVSDWNYANNKLSASFAYNYVASRGYQQTIKNDCASLPSNSSSATLNSKIAHFKNDVLIWVGDVITMNVHDYANAYRYVQSDLSSLKSYLSQILSGAVTSGGSTGTSSTATTNPQSVNHPQSAYEPTVTSFSGSWNDNGFISLKWKAPLYSYSGVVTTFVKRTYEVQLIQSFNINCLLIKPYCSYTALHSPLLSASTKSYDFSEYDFTKMGYVCHAGVTYYVVLFSNNSVGYPTHASYMPKMTCPGGVATTLPAVTTTSTKTNSPVATTIPKPVINKLTTTTSPTSTTSTTSPNSHTSTTH